MLNPNLKLNPKIFDKDVEAVPVRQGFGEGLVEAGEKDPRIVALCADLTESVRMNLFAEKFPTRFFEIGIAEQNMASVASGLAAMGMIPFIGSYAMFSPGRNWEQIRTTVAYNNQPVKILGSHSGVVVGPDGGTHQALEDIALMRATPNMVVISPCDTHQAKLATLAIAKTSEPTYLRTVRDKSAVVTTPETSFQIGKAQILFDTQIDMPDQSLDVAIVATGHLVHRALLAAKKLEGEGKKVAVMNIHTIKPIDVSALVSLAKRTKGIVTVEDHQVVGGLGSAVAEALAENHPTKIEFVGVKNLFGQSGTPDELIKFFGLDENTIYKAAQKFI